MIKIVLYHLQLTNIKFQLQKTYNGLIWGPNTEWTFSKSTESPYAFCAKNINIENSKIIKFIFISIIIKLNFI